MKYIIILLLMLLHIAVDAQSNEATVKSYPVVKGQMPALAKDRQNRVHLVYGSGDSILYVYSTGNGSTFSQPALVAVLPHVFTHAMRGPQIAATGNGLIVIAATSAGDIYSFYKPDNGSWSKSIKVNDAAASGKEGLTGLGANGSTAFAVWLDTRGNGHNKIYGARSADGGKTWSKNILVYASPDTTVCECCKPSVVVRGNSVHVMFRNWLQGSRDLYLARSEDGGSHFAQAQKLGTGTWKLDGCPMDGGGLTVDEKGMVSTVWRRENTIYTVTPGAAEKELGQGKSCTIAQVNGSNAFAWVDKGQVVVLTPAGQRKVLGTGKQPAMQPLDDRHLLCVWENDKRIYASVVPL